MAELNSFAFSVTNADKAEIDAQLGDVQGADVQTIKTSSLTGETVLWISIAGLAVQALPTVWDAVKFFIDRNRVKSIEVNGVRIENPNHRTITEIMKIIERGDDKLE